MNFTEEQDFLIGPVKYQILYYWSGADLAETVKAKSREILFRLSLGPRSGPCHAETVKREQRYISGLVWEQISGLDWKQDCIEMHLLYIWRKCLFKENIN